MFLGAQKRSCRENFYRREIFVCNEFPYIAWDTVYLTQYEAPTMFTSWACKQVMGIAITNLNQSKYKDDQDPKYPSYDQEIESFEHILFCSEVGTIEAIIQSIDLVDGWMTKAGKDTALKTSIIEEIKGQGGRSMMNITCFKGTRFVKFAPSQDIIG